MKIKSYDAGFSLSGTVWLVLVLLLAGSAVEAANYVYVNDSLRVGVRNEPLNNVPPVGVVLTGMKLEILDEKDGFLKIRTSEGLEGWVKDIYVTKDAPAVIELVEVKKQSAELEKKKNELEADLKTLQQAQQALALELDALKEEKKSWVLEQARAASRNSSSTSWGWWAFLLIIVMAASFSAGVLWYKQQLTRRLGGLKL